MNLAHRAVLVLASLAAPGLASGAGDLPAFGVEHFGPREGLRAGTIDCLRFDAAGTLWIGTREGLVSYDGYTFTTFTHDVGDPDSLVDNWVRTVHEDASSRLWVGTNTGGLERLDRATGTFRSYRHRAADATSLSHDSVYAIADAADGKLWVGTQSGLNLFDPGEGRAQRVALLPASDPRSGTEYVFAIAPAGDGTLWLTTVGHGAFHFDPRTGKAGRLPAAEPTDAGGTPPRSPNLASLPHPDAFGLALDDAGALWIGTRRGLAVRSADGTITREAPAPGPRGSLALGDEITTVIARGTDGDVWIGTLGGVYRAPARSRVLEKAGAGIDGAAIASIRTVTSLAIDPGGSVWIGTAGAGLYRLRRPPAPFRAIRAGVPGAQPALSYKDVTALHTDRAGRLWIGTFGGGVDLFDPAARATTKVVLPLERNRYDGILRFAEDPSGAIWIASTGGLTRWDPVARRATSYVHDADDPASLPRGYVSAVLVDRDGRVWAGTGGGGLARLRPDGLGFDRFPVRANDPATPSDGFVTVLHQDREGRIWEGTRSGGLNVIDPSTGAARRIPVEPSNPEGLAHHYVTAILEDARGRLWVGTGGGGLARLASYDTAPGPDGAPRGSAPDTPDVAVARFARVTARDGLIDDAIVALVEDDDGSLWVSTRQGLTRFHPDRGAFVSYGEADGLPSSEGNVSCAARGPDEIYVGMMNGLGAIPRGTPFPAPTRAVLALTALRTPRGSAADPGTPWPPREVEIRYGDVLTAEFAVVDFDPHRRHRYGYRFTERASATWTDLGPRRQLTFTDLSPGHHVLELRGRGARGNWSDPPVRLALRVVPPFWRTRWFQALGALAVIALALTWHATRTARLARRNRELTILQAQREAALREAHDKGIELQAALDDLRRLTRRLEAAKEEERKRIARELHDELGQLLTAAKMNVQLLERLDFDERAPARLADTVGLLDEMIHHVRQISFDLRPPLMDDLGLIAALQGHLDAIAARSGLSATLHEQDLPARLPAEVEVAAYRIVQEAVTNAVRHAGASRIDVTLRGTTDGLEVTVRDDGRGFDVDRSSRHGAGGRHLGLPGMRERALALGGDLSIQSAPGRGTLVRTTLTLPGGRD